MTQISDLHAKTQTTIAALTGDDLRDLFAELAKGSDTDMIALNLLALSIRNDINADKPADTEAGPMLCKILYELLYAKHKQDQD